MITGLFLLVFGALGAYALLRYLFPKTGETRVVPLVLGWLALAMALQHATFALIIVVLVGIFRERVSAFLTDCGITRDRVETIVNRFLKRNR